MYLYFIDLNYYGYKRTEKNLKKKAKSMQNINNQKQTI